MPPFTREQLELLHKLLQSQLQTCKPDLSTPTCSFSQIGDKKVKVADGSFSTIAGKGTAKLMSFMVSGRVIGNAREFKGFYFLEDGDNSSWSSKFSLFEALITSVVYE
ncbi:hypothetical protein KY290_010479 [Solanum tuberosum]|uniref:Dirigent protein n=1 Tax=Solanum tuberosum TaxID=4113 RepID=A0ABQ7W0L7_SOLTU|nr:hypothetical protein KY290_010479 [Solanum tuberosum]